MQHIESKYGVFTFDDSGIPSPNDVESVDYTTVVILHGLVFHKGCFDQMLKYAGKHNTRLILVNRRDYPGSEPYTDKQRKLLLSESEEEYIIGLNMQIWMKHRAREIYEFLALFSKNERIPAYMPSKKTGGIILTGWSLGSAFITAMLSSMERFPSVIEGINMKQYLYRMILYDPPYHVLGYPSPNPKFYDPLLSPENADETPEERGRNFAAWVSGFYDNGPVDVVSDLQSNGGVENSIRSPTICMMTPEYIQNVMHPPAGAPDGSDMILFMRGIKYNVYNALRIDALYLSNAMRDKTNSDDPKAGMKNTVGFINGDHSGNEWSHLEVVHVLCDHSPWVTPYGMIELKAEVELANSKGKRIRDVKFVKLEGLNHFAHWEDPEATLKALLSTTIND